MKTDGTNIQQSMGVLDKIQAEAHSVELYFAEDMRSLVEKAVSIRQER